MSNLISTFQERFGDWLTALGQHLQLSLLTLIIAIFLSIPLAIYLSTRERASNWVLQLRCGNFTVYFDHKGKSSGLPWIKLCFSVTGNSGYDKIRIPVCTGRICSSWYCWYDPGADHWKMWNQMDRYRASHSCNGTGSCTDRSGACRKCCKYSRTS